LCCTAISPQVSSTLQVHPAFVSHSHDTSEEHWSFYLEEGLQFVFVWLFLQNETDVAHLARITQEWDCALLSAYHQECMILISLILTVGKLRSLVKRCLLGFSAVKLFWDYANILFLILSTHGF
jgi:hypothetical protein